MQEPLAQWARIPDGFHEREGGRAERLKRVESLSTRYATRELLDKQFDTLANTTVLDAITAKPGVNGFITKIYTGTPEEIESTLYERLSGDLKRIAFREPFDEKHFLTIFR